MLTWLCRSSDKEPEYARVRSPRVHAFCFFSLLLVLLSLGCAASIPPYAEDPAKEDYLHYQRKPFVKPAFVKKDVAAEPPSEAPSPATNNPDVTQQPPKGPSSICSLKREGSDCSVLADFKTSSIILSGGHISFLEGGCGTALPRNPNGNFQGLIPCEKGEKIIWGDCQFEACLAGYGNPVENKGAIETNGNLVLFTCTGDGTFILIAPNKNVNVNYHTLFQYKLYLPVGVTNLQWSCGVGLKNEEFYTPKSAVCKSHRRSLAEVANEYMKLTGKCPLCSSIVTDPKYHMEHCPKNVKTELKEKDLRSWMFFRRLLHWGHKIAFWLEFSILFILIVFMTINVDTVGAIDTSKLINAKSTSCTAFDVGASDAVTTFIRQQTCTGTTCTGSVDIDTTLQGLNGFTQRFKLGSDLNLDLRVKSAYYDYSVNRQYDACDSIILQSSTSTCGGDGCDICKKKITNYLLFKEVPKTNNWGCDGGCLAIDQGCTCASCTHAKNGNCYSVGETVANEAVLILDIQAGGKCSEYTIEMSKKSNTVLITQLSEENKLNDMVAIKDGVVYSGTINKLGQFGGFNDLKFKTDTDIECTDAKETFTNCNFGHTMTYTFTKCCSDTQSLASSLTVRANWIDNSHYQVSNSKIGTFRFILTVPDVPITRDPSDVSLTINCRIVSGCYSCASGAKLSVEASATGPGWFGVSVKGGNIRPNQMVVNSGKNTQDFTIYLGFKTGKVTVYFDSFSCTADYNLEDPGTDATNTDNPNVNYIPGDVCGFICGLSNFFNLPQIVILDILKGLGAIFAILFLIASVVLIRRAYRFEKARRDESEQTARSKKNDEDLNSINSPRRSRRETNNHSHLMKRNNLREAAIVLPDDLAVPSDELEKHKKELEDFEKTDSFKQMTMKERIEYSTYKNQLFKGTDRGR